MRGLRHIAVFLALACLGAPARADPDSGPEHQILASGELRLGNFWRDRYRRLLTVDGTGNVLIEDAQLDHYAFQAGVDFDLKAENTLSDDVIVDITNRVHAEFDSPDDIQGGRYKLVDNRFQAIWGLALDDLTTFKTDVLVKSHIDVLFPETSATSADLTLALDEQLKHDTWLTFAFTGDYTHFAQDESPDYFEGLGKIALAWHDPRRVTYDTLPTPVQFPAPPPVAGPDDAFRYGQELGLHDSKRLFPLGSASLIGRAAPPPLVVSPEDRLFKEHQQSGSDYGEIDLALRGRTYSSGDFSDWRRLELNALYELNPSRQLSIEVSNQLAAQQYKVQQPELYQSDHLDDRVKVQGTRVTGGSRETAYVAVGFHRFPTGEDRLDAIFYEGGLTGLWRFGRRYWLYSDTFYTDIVPDQRAADYPEKREFIMTLGFTVDFTPYSHLTLSSRESRISVPQFETFFDSSYIDDTMEARYHHQLHTHVSVETGVRLTRRQSDTTLDDNRRETLYFLDTVLEL